VNAIHFTYREGRKAEVALRVVGAELETASGERLSVPRAVPRGGEAGLTYVEKYSEASADFLVALTRPPIELVLAFDSAPSIAFFRITEGMSAADRSGLARCLAEFKAWLR
jgi:hypothetical protein